MPELLVGPTPKEALPAKIEASPVRYEMATVKTYPDDENKMQVLDEGFEGEHLAVPFTPRGGKQSGRDGRQLAIGTDPNNPSRLIMPEDVRPYDGLRDDRRNKAPNQAENVVVFERTGSKTSGFRLFEATGGRKFERVERGAEFSLGKETLTVVGLDKKGNIILYKGKLDYTPLEPSTPGINGKVSDKTEDSDEAKRRIKGPDYTYPKLRFPEVTILRKRDEVVKEAPTISELPPAKPSSEADVKKFTPDPQITKPAWGPLEHVPGVDKPGYPKFKEEPYSSLSPREVAKLRGVIREFDYLIRDEKIPDATTRRRVKRLMTLKLPNLGKRSLAVLPLIGLLAVALATSRSTNPNIPRPQYGNEPIGGNPFLDVPMPELWGPLDPSPAKAVEPVPTPEGIPAANREPKDVEEFRKGVGLGKVKTVLADYTVRDDYEDKIKPNAPRNIEGTRLEDVEGYSIIGMVQSDIARVINPDLEQDAKRLEAEGKTLPEGDPRLPRTLALFREKMEKYYKAQGWDLADSLYPWMLQDFEARARVGIATNNGELGKEFTQAALDTGKIAEGRFKKPVIDRAEMGRWFGSWLEAGPGGNPDKWEDFAGEVTEQVRQETK